MPNNRKGITLIALVITIIVLLILAGISISMLSGDNSILTRGAEAKTSSDKATIEEELRLAINGLAVDYHLSSSNLEGFRDYIFSTEVGKGQDQLKAELGSEQIEFNAQKNEIICKGQAFTVDENGIITLKQPADPNQGFWINDTQISTHSLEEILQQIDAYIDAIAANESNLPNLSEYGISSLRTETSNHNAFFKLNFTEYDSFELQVGVSMATDTETGDSMLFVETPTHSPTAEYRSPEIQNENDSVSLDNGFKAIIESIEVQNFNKIFNALYV